MQQTMYPGLANSPQTELAAAIDDSQNTIPLLDASKVPAAPNIATIGSDEMAETVLYTGIIGNDLTGVTRGMEGTAKAWGAGSKVARNFTAKDYDTLRQNVEGLAGDLAVHEADYTLQVPYAIATGAANTYAVALDPAPNAYVGGMAVAVKINIQNTGASTINVNGLGAKSVLKANGSAVASGNLKANSIYTLRYNGTSFILQGEGGEYGTATAPDVLSGKTIGTDSGLVNGTMPNRGSIGVTPSANSQSYSSGYYSGITVYEQEGGVKAGTTVYVNDPTMFINQSTTPTKKREYQLNAGGTYRISFDLYMNGGGAEFANGRIYRNDVPIGQARQTSSNTAITFTEDIAGWKENDRLSFYINSSNGFLEARMLNLKLSILAPTTTL